MFNSYIENHKLSSIAKQNNIYYDDTRKLFISFKPLEILTHRYSDYQINHFLNSVGIRRETFYQIISGYYMPTAVCLNLMQKYLNYNDLMDYDYDLNRLIKFETNRKI